MTKSKFAVLGDPIEHSLSPAIHLAAYAQLGLDWGYERVLVRSGELAEFSSAEGLGFSGFSVTMPLKAEAASIASHSDDLVRQLGIANTLIRTDGGLFAFNTDVFGITKALGEFWSTNPASIALLGAGATARSALLAIHQNAPSAKVTVYARESTDTNPITKLANSLGLLASVRELTEFGTDHELTVNTIPAQSSFARSAEQNGWLLDVNYSNPDQLFNGLFDSHKVVSGKAMLLWQAIAQIRLFMTLDASKELPNEAAVLRAMTAAL
jgi:shikimate dehydrogenase